jgi:hypothetical protein
VIVGAAIREGVVGSDAATWLAEATARARSTSALQLELQAKLAAHRQLLTELANQQAVRGPWGPLAPATSTALVARLRQVAAGLPDARIARAPIAPAVDAAMAVAALGDARRLLDGGFTKLAAGTHIDEPVADLAHGADAWERVVTGDLLPLPADVVDAMRANHHEVSAQLRSFQADRAAVASGAFAYLPESLWPHWDAVGRMRSDVELAHFALDELGPAPVAM